MQHSLLGICADMIPESKLARAKMPVVLDQNVKTYGANARSSIMGRK
jgi:hypothetical protein